MKRPESLLRFTLIELLVVISIIAVLASMLLPALGRARESAKRVACVNQVRQFTMAAITYSDEWDDVLPGRNGTQSLIWRNDSRISGAIQLWNQGYIAGGLDLMLCPSREKALHGDQRFFGSRLWEQGYSSYSFVGGSAGFKDNVNGTGNYAYSVKLTRHDANNALFADAVINPDPPSSFTWLNVTNHFRSETAKPIGGNVSFPDGHVEWVEWSTSNWKKPNVDAANYPLGSQGIGWYTVSQAGKSSNKYFMSGGTMGDPIRGFYLHE